MVHRGKYAALSVLFLQPVEPPGSHRLRASANFRRGQGMPNEIGRGGSSQDSKKSGKYALVFVQCVRPF